MISAADVWPEMRLLVALPSEISGCTVSPLQKSAVNRDELPTNGSISSRQNFFNSADAGHRNPSAFARTVFHRAAFWLRASSAVLHATGSKKTSRPILTDGNFRAACCSRSQRRLGRHSGAKRISRSFGASTYWVCALGCFTDSTCNMVQVNHWARVL